MRRGAVKSRSDPEVRLSLVSISCSSPGVTRVSGVPDPPGGGIPDGPDQENERRPSFFPGLHENRDCGAGWDGWWRERAGDLRDHEYPDRCACRDSHRADWSRMTEARLGRASPQSGVRRRSQNLVARNTSGFNPPQFFRFFAFSSNTKPPSKGMPCCLNVRYPVGPEGGSERARSRRRRCGRYRGFWPRSRRLGGTYRWSAG